MTDKLISKWKDVTVTYSKGANLALNNNNNNFLTAIGLSPGGSDYFTCIQNMKLVNTKYEIG